MSFQNHLMRSGEVTGCSDGRYKNPTKIGEQPDKLFTEWEYKMTYKWET